MSKNAAVTGAGGYLAGALIPHLERNGWKVTALSRSNKPQAFSDSVHWINGDISDPLIWKTLLSGNETVFHLAGQTSAAWADSHPEEDWKINVAPVLNFIETAKQMRVQPAMIFAGTATQCGIPVSIPVSETHPDQPITVYDRHKLDAEQALLRAAGENIVRAVSLRFCNIYGQGASAGASDRGILNQMIKKAAAGEPLTLYKETSGRIRDYLFIQDAIESFRIAAENMGNVSGKFFYIGSGVGHTLREAYEKIITAASKPVTIQEISGKTSPIDNRNFITDFSLFQSLTGWKPSVSLDRGIQHMLNLLI